MIVMKQLLARSRSQLGIYRLNQLSPCKQVRNQGEPIASECLHVTILRLHHVQQHLVVAIV